MTSARPVTAAMGMPPPSDFAMVIMSGSIPKCSEANHFPSARLLQAIKRFAASTASYSLRRRQSVRRTGKWFASEHFGIEPDMITMAKSLGGGMPIAAVTGRAKSWMRRARRLGGTYCGHPLSCAAALAAIENHRERRLAHAVHRRRQTFRDASSRVGRKNGHWSAHSRLGGMCAIELVRQRADSRAAESETNKSPSNCYKHGLITITAGTSTT